MPRCAVIMAVYNESPTLLSRAVQSILAQTFGDFAFIIVDDGSTSKETCDALGALSDLDPRINVLRKENGGPMSAANFGIEQTDAPLIVRHDSDDWSSPNRLEKQTAFMTARPDVVVSGSACRLYQEDGFAIADCIYPQTPEEVQASLSRINPFAHGSTCFRRAVAEEIGFYDSAFRSVGDYDFFWRLIDHAAKSSGPATGGANLPDVLYHYTYRRGSVSETRVRERRRNRGIIQLRAQARAEGSDLSYSEADARLPNQTVDQAAALVDHADDLMRAGKFASAFPNYVRGWLKKPLRVKSILKLGRLAAYSVLPHQRWRMFNDKYRVLQPVQNR